MTPARIAENASDPKFSADCQRIREMLAKGRL
jgi:hypothetical protein